MHTGLVSGILLTGTATFSMEGTVIKEKEPFCGSQVKQAPCSVCQCLIFRPH